MSRLFSALLGVGLMFGLSTLWTPPVVWFGLCFVVVLAFQMFRRGLALLVAGPLAPSTARAGCSHYAISLANQAELEQLADLRILTIGDGPEDARAPLQKPDLPCSGPTCSRGPSHPQAPAPPAPVRTEPCCHLGVPASLEGPERGPRLLEDAPGRPIVRPTSIDRPPRPVRSPHAA